MVPHVRVWCPLSQQLSGTRRIRRILVAECAGLCNRAAASAHSRGPGAAQHPLLRPALFILLCRRIGCRHEESAPRLANQTPAKPGSCGVSARLQTRFSSSRSSPRKQINAFSWVKFIHRSSRNHEKGSGDSTDFILFPPDMSLIPCSRSCRGSPAVKEASLEADPQVTNHPLTSEVLMVIILEIISLQRPQDNSLLPMNNTGSYK